MRKVDEIADPDSCLNQAADDEILFVLKANDPIAPDVVEEWARKSQHYGIHLGKIEEAWECAQKMRAWQKAQGIR